MMKTVQSIPNLGLRISDFGFLLLLLLSTLNARPEDPQPSTNSALRPSAFSLQPSPSAPSTPREFFNAGTQKLSEGKLREAEAFLESALASQTEPLQPPALYNLGHIRFAQGLEQLKNSPPARSTLARGRAAQQLADDAIRAAEEALGGHQSDRSVAAGPASGAVGSEPGADLQKLVAAYLRGRGARKELKAAIAVVQRALEAHRVVLNKWQRAADDFKSALELNHADADARHNADTVDRHIARLVDSVRELQQCLNGMCGKKDQLGQKMQQLKGRIPGSEMPPGGAGDSDEDDDDQPLGPQPGQQEGASREGEQMHLSPEQAGWILDGFKLDSERRLPMGGNQPAEPRNRSRPAW